MTNAPKALPENRKRFQFSLKSLWLVTFIFGIALGIYVYVKQNHVGQEGIQSWSEFCTVDEWNEESWTEFDKDAKSVGLAFMDENDISLLTKFKNVESISFGYAKIKDLTPLSELEHLRSIALTETSVSDLSSLQKLTQIDSLSLSGNGYDLSILKKLPHLKYLQLQNDFISDFSFLDSLNQLEDFSVHMKWNSDLPRIKKHIYLKVLYISGINLVDITPLQNLPNLEVLHIFDTQISNLTPLEHLQNLKELSIVNCNISEDHIHNLQNSLPNCKIDWLPGPHFYTEAEGEK